MAVHPAHAVSVCSGYGGIDLGFRLALGERCRTVLYCEREAYGAAVLVSQMEAGNLDAAPVWSDLATLPARGIIDRLGLDPAGVIMHGGIPCQPFSTAGQRKGSEDERWLWPAFWRVAQDAQVGWIFLENVRGFVSGAGSGLDLVLRDLSRAGWDAEWDLFSAEEAGAPHKRERVFLLAHAPGIGRRQAWAEFAGREGNAAPVGGGAVGDAGYDVTGRENYSRKCGDAGRLHLCERPEGAGRLTDAGFELADRDGDGLSRPRLYPRSRKEGGGTVDALGGYTYWPSRPGEEQRPGEPPRVVVYAKGAGHQRREGFAVPGQARPENAGTAERDSEVEPRLGGDADGTPVVLDKRFGAVWAGRLSALGNGVMPIVAAVGYRTLWWRLMEGLCGQ